MKSDEQGREKYIFLLQSVSENGYDLSGFGAYLKDMHHRTIDELSLPQAQEFAAHYKKYRLIEGSF